MTIHYSDDQVTLHHGDCLDVLRELPDNSVDAVVTDPPYNLSFMAKPWDAYEGREDAGFAYWLSGLIDGEGSFTIKAHTRGTHAPMFRLKLRDDERSTIEKIRRTMGVGNITEHPARDGSKPQVAWDVQDKAGCQRLVDLLDKYPLRAKKRVDYWAWREAVCEWTSRPRGNRWQGRADNTRMAALRDRLMDNRMYTEIPWSGHEFQDWCRLWATECLRILKPGGHLLSFGGSRTWHRLAAAVEDAGFEIRDSIAWLYGSGFPKSLDVSKAIDKRRDDDADVRRVTGWLAEQRDKAGLTNRQIDEAFGFSGMAGHWTAAPQLKIALVPQWEQWQKLRELIGFGDEMDAEVWRLNGRKGTPGDAWDQREVVGTAYRVRRESTVQIVGLSDGDYDLTAPATEAAQKWQGWGTALKPAFEPIVVARKPLGGTVAANVLEHGTGALNIDACRTNPGQAVTGGGGWAAHKVEATEGWDRPYTNGVAKTEAHTSGRWPTNVVLDESQAAELDKQTGVLTSGYMKPETDRTTRQGDAYGRFSARTATATYGDSGGASRFFPVFRYEAKAPTSERPRDGEVAHPTVKPLDLMRWLVRLVTPPGGTVLEPFAGSGTTAEACVIEGFKCIAIEREADYLPLIVNRLSKPIQMGLDFEGGGAA